MLLELEPILAGMVVSARFSEPPNVVDDNAILDKDDLERLKFCLEKGANCEVKKDSLYIHYTATQMIWLIGVSVIELPQESRLAILALLTAKNGERRTYGGEC